VSVVPKMSQEMLAGMIGTTRSRVSCFMNRFRKLCFIDYDTGSGLQVHSSLLGVVPRLIPGTSAFALWTGTVPAAIRRRGALARPVGRQEQD
jgi:hypothetical protein